MEVTQKRTIYINSNKSSSRLYDSSSKIEDDNNLSLSTILSLSVNMENVSNRLSTKEIDYMKKIIYRNQEVIDTITRRINDVISDGRLDLHEIPTVILIISDIYKLYFINEKISDVSIEKIILFTMHSLIEYKYFNFSKNNIDIINNVVNTSLKLLKYQIDIKKELKEVRKWWSFFGYFLSMLQKR